MRIVFAPHAPFNVGKTDKNLLLRGARTQRCAVEGELLFGLTKHVAILVKREGNIKRAVLRVFWPLLRRRRGRPLSAEPKMRHRRSGNGQSDLLASKRIPDGDRGCLTYAATGSAGGAGVVSV